MKENFTEGYTDGLHGAGMPDRNTRGIWGWYADMRYREGFILGSLDRHASRVRDAAQREAAQQAEYEVVAPVEKPKRVRKAVKK